MGERCILNAWLAAAIASAASGAGAQSHPATTPTTAISDEKNADGSFAALDAVLVTARGSTRQVQRIDRDAAQALPPGTSPLKVLEKLPGVHFESSDPFGNYEWSTRISLRGFNQQRLGFTLDGIPLGDMSYGNHNGLHISRAMIAENLALTELAQGVGALGTASTSNLGGVLQFLSDDPAAETGARASATVGSDNLRRAYARLDTGDRRGFAAYISAVNSDVDKWKGYGDHDLRQFNSKAVYDFDGQRLWLLINTSRRNEVDYADLSLDSQRRLGWGWDNYAPDWPRAVAAARGQFSGGVNHPDDAYYSARGMRDDDLVGIGAEFALQEAWSLRATGYYHRNEGQGHWFTPYVASSASVPIALRATEYDIERHGLIAVLSYSFGAHVLEAGFWGEDGVHGLQRNFYYIDGPVIDDYFFSGPDQRLLHQRFDYQTRQLHIQDTLRLLDDRLTLDFGFKSPRTETRARSYVGSRSSGRLVAEDDLLPQFGGNFRVDSNTELFASYARNVAAFQAGVAGPFAAGQGAFDTFASSLKPEQSRTLEAGLRHVGARHELALALYDVDFDNRLLLISRCAAVVGCPLGVANVGSATSRGAELTFVWQPSDALRWFNSISYNRSRYADDYLDGTRLVQTAGKTVVDTPRELFATELVWTRGPWQAHLGAKYTGRRYITYLNDASVASFWLGNAALSYDFTTRGLLSAAKIHLGVTNLANKRYFATVGSTGFVPNGSNYTLLEGTPRSLFLSVELGF